MRRALALSRSSALALLPLRRSSTKGHGGQGFGVRRLGVQGLRPRLFAGASYVPCALGPEVLLQPPLEARHAAEVPEAEDHHGLTMAPECFLGVVELCFEDSSALVV